MIIETLNDPVLLEGACEVYASLDDISYQYVGTAYLPCTDLDPFKLPCDPGLIGATIYLKISGRNQELKDAKAHPCVIREEILAISGGSAPRFPGSFQRE